MQVRLYFIFLLSVQVFAQGLFALTVDEKLALEDQKKIQQREQIQKEIKDLLAIQNANEKIRKKLKEKEEKEAVFEEDKTEVYIKDIVVLGVTKFSNQKINSIINKYKSKNLTKKEITQLQLKLQNLYLNKGYTAARIYFDLAELSVGILKFVASEGKIENIQFESHKYGRLQIFTAFPFIKNKIFNIRDIEQGLEQMNRLGSNDVVMKIKPGQEEGATIVEISNNLGKRTRFNMGLDNSGDTHTSEYRGTFGLSTDNLFRLNDNLNIRYSQGLRELETRDFYSKNYSLGFSVPFGYWTFNYNCLKSEYLTKVKGTVNEVISFGDSETQTLGVDRILLRGQKYRFSSGADFTVKETNSFVNNKRLDVSSRKLVPVNIYILHTLYMRRGSLSLKMNYKKGLDTFGAKKDIRNLPKGQPRAQYEAFGISGYFLRNFRVWRTNFPIKYNMNYRCQYTWQDLFGSEQFGPSVRGFKDGNLSGESGISISNDVKTAVTNIFPFFKWHWLKNTLSNFYIGVFYDIGTVVPQTYGTTQTMSGCGISLNGRIFKYLSLSCSLASSVEVPETLKKEKNVLTLNLNAEIPVF